jgi:hypothetical protein
MQTYADALKAYLDKPENKVTDLAAAVGTFQPNITRYQTGERFPNAEMARKIDDATKGAVPFSLWHTEFLSRSGLEADAA